jgi:hypothetical protein
MDCIAAVAREAGNRFSPLITNAENAKNTPPIRPQPTTPTVVMRSHPLLMSPWNKQPARFSMLHTPRFIRDRLRWPPWTR